MERGQPCPPVLSRDIMQCGQTCPRSDVDLTRTGGISDPGIDAAVANERRQVEDYADKAKFWPVAKISLNFSF